ncbi:MAG: TonB-dependent receptor [Verrucomicrobia bacterium]|nr:TonB-dependent receptor [Verrucomicrobiota bacterium]
MKPFLRLRFVLLMLVGCFAALVPSFAQTAATGTLSGRVQSEATGRYLTNARVTVKGTDLVAFTDESGSYRLSHVPAGAAIVEAFYSGLEPRTATVAVTAGQNTERDFGLTVKAAVLDASGVLKMDAFVASTSKVTEGETLATNEQRFAPNIKNVVATDAFGDIAEGNVAEFMKFLPGVAIDYSDAMPLSIGLRGMDPALTEVSADGGQMANATSTGTSRKFDFTQASINNIARIEVYKVPTPATSASSLSGSVNMVSKSSFERSRAQFNFRVNATTTSDGLQLKKQPFPFEEYMYRIKPGFDFDYTLPVNKNFGIVVTGSYSEKYNEQNIIPKTWNAVAAGTGATTAKPYLQSFQVIDAPKWYERESLGLKADYRVTRNSVLSVGSTLNHYKDFNGNNSMTFNAGTTATPSIAGGTSLSYGPDFTQGATGRGAVTMTNNLLHLAARTISANARYRYEDGDWRADVGAYASDSQTWRRFEERGHFQNVAVALRNPVRVNFQNIGDVGPATVVAYDNANNIVNLYDLRNYTLTTANTTSAGDVSENVSGGDFNVKRKFNLFGLPAALQTGAAQKEQIRDRHIYNYSYTYVPAVAGDTTPLPFQYQVYGNRPNYFGYDNLPFVSPNRAVTAWRENPALFTQTTAQKVTAEQNRINGSDKLRETINAAYLQGEIRLFNRLQILTGVRYEKVNDKGAGALIEPNNVYVRNPDGTFAHGAPTAALPRGPLIRKPEAGAAGSLQELYVIRTERGAKSNVTYDGYYPSLHLNYNATPNAVLRLAYARTYGRPDFSSITPNSTITPNDVDPTNNSGVPGTINVRNVGLKPYTANNYDFSAEYYTDAGGLFTAGVFRKDIKNFFATVTRLATPADLESIGFDDDFLGWQLTTTANVGDAHITGGELSARQSLKNLGGWARYFSVFANGTKLKLDNSVPGSFTRFLPLSVNWGVTYSKRPFSVSLNWNARGEQNQGTSPTQGADASVYFNPAVVMDMNASYQMTTHLALFVTGTNVFNRWRTFSRYADATPDYARRSQTNSYGSIWSLGVRGTF